MSADTATDSPKVASVTLRGAARLDAVSFALTSGTVLSHGGEYLTSATLCWDKHDGDTRNFFAQLTTNAGSTVTAGTATVNCAIATAPDGFGIVGMYGQDGDEMDQLGWIYAQQ
ncbi:hypothetical protein OH77DRAFT_1524604 [Trametes cingulata]|nr:hypothetical protein OH77DRAFT_1524604 [Trametes cingulata]